MIDPEKLPADVEKLKAIISQQIQIHQNEIRIFKDQLQGKDNMICNKDREIQARDKKIKKRDDSIQSRDQEIDFLREALRLARMARFAAQSEKLPSGQSELFNEAETESLSNDLESQSEESEDVIQVPGHSRIRPKRKPLPEHLPREEVIIDLSDAEKICDKDGTVLKEIGAEVSEQLDIIPAQMKVIRTIRKKYACPCCNETLKTAKLPEKILPKSNATPGLLAYIATSKYVDALPLYRLEQIFKRSEIDLPRNTMAAWMIAISEKLQPIYNLMEEELLESDYVCCDETRVQVLHEVGKSPESQSYMWVRSRHGPNTSPIVLFDYDPTRSKTVPERLLKDFKGYLQVDGYAGYDGICNGADIIRVGCMAHVRRKFFDVHKLSKKKGGEANQVLKMIQKLYGLEAEIKDKSIEERKEVRQKSAKVILDEIKSWLDGNQNRYPPESLMGKAITYASNQWPHVIRYIEYGKLSIDNNFTENRIRPFAIGRKNWLFSDSVAGAEASGMIYSILQSARGNGLEPYAYMRHLLTELPLCQTADQIEKLLPHKIDPKILN